MNNNLKGGFYGCVAAVSYGMNPLCALRLYQDGLTVPSVLTYRFAIGTLILGLLMLGRRQSFALTRREGGVLLVLGALFAGSSLSFFISFNYMAAGIAATLVFAYPVMVAIIMAVFFRERLKAAAVAAIIMTVAGIGLLFRGDGDTAIAPVGIAVIMFSALTYALYIVVVNRSQLVMSSVKLTFYAMLVCLACVAIYATWSGEPIQWLTTPREWFFATFLGLVPTVISLVTMAMAIRCIGSTPTAIMGALEPVTAIVIGVCLFGEAVTPRLLVGIALILLAVTLIVGGNHVPRPARVWRVVRHGRLVRKLWRWRV